MNKKFSTLVASLLLSSAFSVYAGNAKPMLATPTQVETRATSADVEEAKEWTVDLAEITGVMANHILPGFTNNARLYALNQVAGTTSVSLDPATAGGFVKFDTTSGVNQPVYGLYSKSETFYWTLENSQLVDNAGHVFTVDGSSNYFEVIPVKKVNAPSYYFVLGTRDSQGNLSYVQCDASASFKLVTPLTAATTFFSVETAYTDAYIGKDLNDILNSGFNLAISSLKDENAEITHSEAFSGVLKAMEDKDNLSTTRNYYHLMNEDGKFIGFDKDAAITSDGYSLKGQFKLVDFTTASANDFGRFQFKKADNGSGLVQVLVGDDDSSNDGSNRFNYRLYVANVNDTYGLSVADATSANQIPAENWAATTLDASTIINPKQFLTGQFYTIDYVGSTNTANQEAYKKGGRLAVLGDEDDYVPASGLYEKAPEAQWAVSSGSNATVDGNKIVFTNRENPSISVTIKELRKDAGKTYYRVSDITKTTGENGIDLGDCITITPVAEHSQNDGYAVFDANDLRNKTWYLGQARQTADGDINVYWAENHAGSHQIGATVEEEKASKWNLSLVTKNTNVANKPYDTQIDSVLVVSTLQTWNPAKSRIDAVQDTLVILPYAFQNRSNAEFVKFNDGTNLNYYECRPYGLNEEKVFDKGSLNDDKDEFVSSDARFALKMKADGSYNYVVLAPRNGALKSQNFYNLKNGAVEVVTANNYASKKVFQENSTINGTWSQMNMYAKDANSLMFVTEVTAPEYRKLVTTANLDTIKIYRADNEAQVVYEKKDTKASTLLERPVSFLNIDNVEQFKDINPALYADTAYVNRGNNTRYQYLLGVNIEHKEGWYCDEHGFTETPPCKHAVPVSYNQGRYLINMIDTANILAADLKVSIHNNPFINETEEGNKCAKLAFVDAIHVLTDSVDMTKADKLYVINNEEDRTKYSVIDLSTPGFNVAKFAFKYTDSMVDDNFKIQTLWKEYDPAKAQGKHSVTEEGYLRWVNGCVVVDNEYAKGDVFNMNEDETRTPTANEEITAEGSVVVAGTNGAVVVKGAEGKSVIVSTILGKVVANEVLTSDNATIAAPAGVVVVSVDGESFKVVVK